MRTLVVHSVVFAGLLTCCIPTPADAQDSESAALGSQPVGFTSDVRDPVVELQRIRARRTLPEARDSLFRTSPLTPLRGAVLRAENRLDEATNIKFGTAVNHLFQQLSDVIPGEDNFGMSSAMSMVGTWHLYNEGCPNQGELTLGIDGRWGYGLGQTALVVWVSLRISSRSIIPRSS
jgi:hypothetical protein